MARVTEEIILKVSTDVGNSEKALAGLDDALKDVEDSYVDVQIESKKTSQTTKELDDSILSLKTGALAAAAAFTALVAVQIQSQQETLLAAKALGVNAQELANLEGLATRFNATADDVQQGLKNISELASIAAADGQGAKFDAFKELNIDLDKFRSLDPIDQFEVFAKALGNVDNAGDKTRLTLELMQEEGFKLSGVMQAIAEDSDGALEAIQNLQGDLSPDAIAELTANFADLKLSVIGLANAFISEFGPTIAEGFDNILISAQFLRDTIDNIAIAIEGTTRAEFEAVEAAGRASAARDREEKKIRDRGKRAIEIADKQLERDLKAIDAEEIKELQSIEKILDADEKAFNREIEREEELLKRKVIRDARELENAKKTIESIEDAKKRARIDELRELGGGADIAQIEAGSQQGAELLLRAQNAQPEQLAEANRLEKQLADKAIEQRNQQLEAAQETVALLGQINNKQDGVEVVAGGIL